jgi:translocation and assembly module TamA
VIAKDGVDMPATQLFLTGGDTTVRGYGYQSIGVEHERASSSAAAIWSPAAWNGSAPSPCGNRSDWEQTVFVDAGSVADKPSQMTVYTGVGTGIRWAARWPGQADIAYGIKTQQFRLHLRMGFTF